MLSLQPLIITQLKALVPGLTTVANPSVLAGLNHLGALLPAVIVMPGAGTPTEQNPHSLAILEDQDWEIILILAHQNTDAGDGNTEQVAGGFMSLILKALHGWQPDLAMRFGFAYKSRAAPSYNPGYAEFPMSFSAKIMLNKTYF
jgi:hypothetical protein